jgi:hypothetical protein
MSIKWVTILEYQRMTNLGRQNINSLTEHYNVRAPTFVDNNESVNELLPTQS